MELWHGTCSYCRYGNKKLGRKPEEVKLYRIYRRVKVSGKWKFISIGWTCPKCHATDFDDFIKQGEDGKIVTVDALNMTPEERKEWLSEWGPEDDLE